MTDNERIAADHAMLARFGTWAEGEGLNPQGGFAIAMTCLYAISHCKGWDTVPQSKRDAVAALLADCDVDKNLYPSDGSDCP